MFPHKLVQLHFPSRWELCSHFLFPFPVPLHLIQYFCRLEVAVFLVEVRTRFRHTLKIILSRHLKVNIIFQVLRKVMTFYLDLAQSHLLRVSELHLVCINLHLEVNIILQASKAVMALSVDLAQSHPLWVSKMHLAFQAPDMSLVLTKAKVHHSGRSIRIANQW